MSFQEFAASTVFLFVVMALAAFAEVAFPLQEPRTEMDGRRAANLAMTATTFLVNWLLSVGAVLLAAALPLPAPLPMTALPPLLQWIFALLLLDFAFGYLAHRLMHESPLLWRVHRVHHSDPFVDVTTTYRTHPLESAWRYLWMSVPIFVFGIPLATVLVYRVLSAVNGVLEHSNLRVPARIDSAITRVWVTPNMHKLHHSRDARETDTNYGNLLSLHDRLLRTFTPSEGAFTVRYGLEDVAPREIAGFGALLRQPFGRSADPDSRAGEASARPRFT